MRATVQRVKTADSAIRLLSEQPPPSAVLITDEALTIDKNSRVWDAVVQYLHQGGVSVVMGHFSSFVIPTAMKPFFAKADLLWESGSYHRMTLVLNREVIGDPTKLPKQYSQKALFVKNVKSTDALYRTDEDSVLESRVFSPESVHSVGGERRQLRWRVLGGGSLGTLVT